MKKLFSLLGNPDVFARGEKSGSRQRQRRSSGLSWLSRTKPEFIYYKFEFKKIFNVVQEGSLLFKTKKQSGGVAQLVRASACHAEGRGFEPHRLRFAFLFFLFTKNATNCLT